MKIKNRKYPSGGMKKNEKIQDIEIDRLTETRYCVTISMKSSFYTFRQGWINGFSSGLKDREENFKAHCALAWPKTESRKQMETFRMEVLGVFFCFNGKKDSSGDPCRKTFLKGKVFAVSQECFAAPGKEELQKTEAIWLNTSDLKKGGNE